jgi:hypothetical protein
MSALAWLVVVKNDIGVLKPEDDGKGASRRQSFTSHLLTAASLAPPTAPPSYVASSLSPFSHQEGAECCRRRPPASSREVPRRPSMFLVQK